MRRALITGVGGFVGPYLARELASLGYEVWGSSRSVVPAADYRPVELDVRSADDVLRLVREIQPQEIYHLAAISRPSFGRVAEFYEVNLHGSLNVLEAAKTVGASVLLVSSAYVYGRCDRKVDEETRLAPVNAYGASKAAADLAAISYALDGLKAIRVRPFNHSGPGQSRDFLLPTLVHQFASIETGRHPPVLKLGNLDSVRDFSDVRDVVRAYPLLLRFGENGAVYNLASGRGVSVRELADRVSKLVGVEVGIQADSSRQRRNDIPYMVGDASRAKALGWQPEYSLERTLQEMLEYARELLLGR